MLVINTYKMLIDFGVILDPPFKLVNYESIHS